MRGKTLDTIFATLRRLRAGYVMVPDQDGEPYLVMAKREYDRIVGQRRTGEVQLSLPASSSSRPASGARKGVPRDADAVLELINREIALYRESAREEDVWDDYLGGDDGGKVRFEPLQGDLPPELQEDG